ncbi:hypothetical protein [Shimia thalassica]|uniref:hypothetical protein n=1 Tax=Shimia thalassica TaxID=1715693 RepID=UPI0026E2649B|nr:hypothetical protein [Shimia thalassica]MDO6797981.1 hypothetical protein [Shimia thalassica]
MHIGAQKTGSTSLHHFLSRNQDALAARLDIRVPVKGSITRELGRTCALYSLKPETYADDLKDLICTVRDDLTSDDRVCIISHENICGAMMGRAGVTDLYPALPKIIALFEQNLAPYSPEYVFYTREMQSWKSSVYNQAVKSDSYAGTREEFLEQTRASKRWTELQHDLEARLGKDRVRFFALEDEQTPDRPGRQLLRFAGLTDADIDTLQPVAGRSNQSLNDGSLEFMRQLNALGLARPARRQVAELVKNNQTLFAAEETARKL